MAARLRGRRGGRAHRLARGREQLVSRGSGPFQRRETAISSLSKSLRRSLATLIAGAALAAVFAGGASAATAPRAAARASACVYYVKVFAWIRENPSFNSVIRDSRGAFARLTGPCRTSGPFIAVYSSATTDGVGWVDSSKLLRTLLTKRSGEPCARRARRSDSFRRAPPSSDCARPDAAPLAEPRLRAAPGGAAAVDRRDAGDDDRLPAARAGGDALA